MKTEIFFTVIIGLVFLWLFFIYRYDLRNWFLNQYYGKEKHDWIKVVRYPQSHMGAWQEQLNFAVQHLLKDKYMFTYKERENILNQLEDVDEGRFKWKNEVYKRFCGLAYSFTY